MHVYAYMHIRVVFSFQFIYNTSEKKRTFFFNTLILIFVISYNTLCDNEHKKFCFYDFQSKNIQLKNDILKKILKEQMTTVYLFVFLLISETITF